MKSLNGSKNNYLLEKIFFIQFTHEIRCFGEIFSLKNARKTYYHWRISRKNWLSSPPKLFWYVFRFFLLGKICISFSQDWKKSYQLVLQLCVIIKMPSNGIVASIAQKRSSQSEKYKLISCRMLSFCECGPLFCLQKVYPYLISMSSGSKYVVCSSS